MKKPVVIGVLIFIASLYLALKSENAKSAPYIELGRTTFNSELTIGGIGYRTETGKFDFSAQLTGQGRAGNTHQSTQKIFSASRLADPGWSVGSCDLVWRIGAAVSTGQNLIGPKNFRLGVMCRFDFAEIEVGHYSSAGIWRPNTGLDFIMLRFVSF